jgi:hypothetical protein
MFIEPAQALLIQATVDGNSLLTYQKDQTQGYQNI